jgi:glycosyltransferase involved in cell wall biosynthesis
VVEELRPDVVLAHGCWAYFVLGHGVKVGPPVGLFEHGIVRRDLLHRLAGLRAPDFILANSRATAASVEPVFERRRAAVCRCPVLPPRTTSNRSVIRERLGVLEHEVVVLQSSRFEASKGHKLLLEALASIDSSPWNLWYAGATAGPTERGLRAELAATAEARGVSSRVRFLGERRDIGDLLTAADVFCQPSLVKEGYGVGLVEAMSHGLPIVATEEGATSDPLVSTFGFLVKTETRSLSDALRKLIEDEGRRRELGTAARTRYLEHHRPEGAMDQFASLLESVLNKRNGGGTEAGAAWA